MPYLFKLNIKRQGSEYTEGVYMVSWLIPWLGSTLTSLARTGLGHANPELFHPIDVSEYSAPMSGPVSDCSLTALNHCQMPNSWPFSCVPVPPACR